MKQAALVSEKKGPDAFHALEKAKAKVDGFGDEYERLRNGGRPNKPFGLDECPSQFSDEQNKGLPSNSPPAVFHPPVRIK